MRHSPLAHFLVGPTASGKSAVAQWLAEHNGRLIVSADSMNLYRKMNIGTAKPTAAECAKVEYAGVDVVDPTEKFSVATYLASVRPAFELGREVIVSGGTGLYVKCLTEGFDVELPENTTLRAELEALPFGELERRAIKEVPDRYRQLTEDDQKNSRRLIRLLEKKDHAPDQSWNTAVRPAVVGLRVERAYLLDRIARRVHQMYAAGLLEEARDLLALKLSPTALQAIGYSEAFSVLSGEMCEADAIERTIIRTRQLAKRQMTWFRNQLNVRWVDVVEGQSVSDIAGAVAEVWDEIGPVAVKI